MIRVIGIDPGVHTGLADVIDGEIYLEECDFWGAYEYLTERVRLRSMVDLVVIEIATDSHVWHQGGKTTVAKAARTGQHVGAVRREGELLAEGLRRAGFNVKTVPPRGKLDSRRFGAITGYVGRTNAHKRDAGLMAWTEYQLLETRSRATA